MRYKKLLKSLSDNLSILLIAILLLSNLCIKGQLLGDSIRIKFDKFQRVDDRTFHPLTEINVTSLIQFGLIQKENYILNNPSELQRVNKSPYLQSKNLESIEKFDVLIFGTYAIYQNNYIIKVNLFFPKNNKTIYLTSITGSIDSPYIQLPGISKSIINSIESHLGSKEINKKKIGVICKVKDEKRNQGSITYSKDLIIQINQGIEKHNGLILAPWDKTLHYCNEGMKIEDIVDTLQLDAIVVINVELINENTAIASPYLLIKGNDDLIHLGEINEEMVVGKSIDQEITFQINELFNNVITYNGNWNTEPYSYKANSFYEYYKKGEYYASINEPSISNFYLLKALNYNKESAELHFDLADNYLSLDRFLEAQKELLYAININNKFKGAYYKLFLLKINELEYENALLIAEEALKEIPNDVLGLKMMGISLYHNNKFQESITFLDSALVISEEDPMLYVYLGLNQSEYKRYDVALTNFQKALELDPDDKDISYYISNVMIAKGYSLILENKFDEALHYLKDAGNYHTSEDAIDYIRLAYVLNGDLQKAIEYFEEKVKEGYYSPDIDCFDFAIEIRYAYFLNKSLENKEYAEEVINYSKKHLEYNPDDAYAYWAIGNMYSHNGEKKLSLDYLEEAYNRNKLNKEVFLDLSELLLVNGYPEKSEIIYNDVMGNKELIARLSDSEIMILELIHIGNVAATKNKIDNKSEKYILSKLEEGIVVKEWSFKTFKKWVREKLDTERGAEIIELVEKMDT